MPEERIETLTVSHQSQFQMDLNTDIDNKILGHYPTCGDYHLLCLMLIN